MKGAIFACTFLVVELLEFLLKMYTTTLRTYIHIAYVYLVCTSRGVPTTIIACCIPCFYSCGLSMGSSTSSIAYPETLDVMCWIYSPNVSWEFSSGSTAPRFSGYLNLK